MVQNIKKIFNKQGFIRLKGVLDYKEDLEPVLNDMAFIMDRLVHRFVPKKDKVKVGFMQPYFRTDAHAVSRISNDLIRHLQNEQVEVIIIKNNTSKNDILDLKLDVLVYITIGTDAYTYDTSFYRLAPVQCNFWGHINTSGKRHIDYFITSKLFESEQKYFSEKLVNFDSLSTYIIKNDKLKTSF